MREVLEKSTLMARSVAKLVGACFAFELLCLLAEARADGARFELTFSPIYETPAPATHPLARRSVVRPEDLPGTGWIGYPAVAPLGRVLDAWMGRKKELGYAF